MARCVSSIRGLNPREKPPAPQNKSRIFIRFATIRLTVLHIPLIITMSKEDFKSTDYLERLQTAIVSERECRLALEKARQFYLGNTLWSMGSQPLQQELHQKRQQKSHEFVLLDGNLLMIDPLCLDTRRRSMRSKKCRLTTC